MGTLLQQTAREALAGVGANEREHLSIARGCGAAGSVLWYVQVKHWARRPAGGRLLTLRRFNVRSPRNNRPGCMRPRCCSGGGTGGRRRCTLGPLAACGRCHRFVGRPVRRAEPWRRRVHGHGAGRRTRRGLLRRPGGPLGGQFGPPAMSRHRRLYARVVGPHGRGAGRRRWRRPGQPVRRAKANRIQPVPADQRRRHRHRECPPAPVRHRCGRRTAVDGRGPPGVGRAGLRLSGARRPALRRHG